MISTYITPVTNIHSTFDEAKEFADTYGGISLIDDRAPLSVADLAQGDRNLVVGEPGVGKSELLKKLEAYFKQKGVAVTRINLRDNDAIEQIDKYLGTKTELPKTLLLDALDEVKASLFPSMLQKIEEVSAEYPNLPIFLSSRWVFIRRYASSFPDYRFITISPFTHAQVKKYLISAGRSEADVDALLNRIMSFNHQMLVIQIPRYLSYLDDFFEQKGWEAAAEVSRNELFEHFIYSKLELEEEKLNSDKRALTKRVLEKLALTMEIYQTNVITKDELMTFFDDLKSDLKVVALSQIGIEVFYDYSLLKVSRDNLDKIEFENTEFQEYLAAKEITRFSDPNRTAFEFAADPVANEIYPSWYNALTFLVDMQPILLEQLVEFSGLRADQFKVMDEAFLTFLGRIDARSVSSELRHRLFRDVVEYHNHALQWLPGKLAKALPDFFDPSLEEVLKAEVADAEVATGSQRFVPLANASYTIAYLLKYGVVIDRSYWRSRLPKYATDANENGVLQRRALIALRYFGDPAIIDELAEFKTPDELVMQEYIRLCTEVAPNHPKSLKCFIEATKGGEIQGRYGLYSINQPTSIKQFLRALNDDEVFQQKFLDGVSIFGEQDNVLVEHIERVLDDELRELCKETLVGALHHNTAYKTAESAFISGLWKLLHKDDPAFVTNIIKRITSSHSGVSGLYSAQDLFAQVLKKEDLEPFIKSMRAGGEASWLHHVLLRIKFSRRADKDEVYEAGRHLLRDEYKQWEEARAKANTSPEDERAQELLQEFRKLLEPEPGKYNPNVFDFYNRHAEKLDPVLSSDDQTRVEELLSGTVFKFMDPLKYDLNVTEHGDGSKTTTMSDAIPIFGGALATARRLGFDTTPYRQQIINFLPFAQDDHLKVIFGVVKDITPGELTAVLAVYTKRDSDLWRYNPFSFVQAVEQYHVTAAAPVLRALVFESALEPYVRRKAISVLDSISPNAPFLREVAKKFAASSDAEEQNLAYVANGLLITNHAAKDAIKWRLEQIVERAAEYLRSRSGEVHRVGDFEEEISFSKPFATPLMELRRAGYEAEYLELLDEAVALWAKGGGYYEYARYLWEITYAYFDNLKERGSFWPLQMLEDKIAALQNHQGANWLAARMAGLRQSYLTHLGKPGNFSESVTRYNKARAFSEKNIQNADDLFPHVLDALETDIRRWIEDEGAYKVLGYKISDSGNQEYEKLIQRTIKTQVEMALLKRGFQVNQIDVLREPQLLDEKRVDFLVRYGFAGPIVLEVKLTSHKDIQGSKSKIEKSGSYESMKRYMQGFGTSHGVFMVIDNAGATNLTTITETFQKIDGVRVLVFQCFVDTGSSTKKSTKAENS